MTKEEVKKVCEADEKLEWWAMVLFAEICELVTSAKNGGYDAKTAYPIVESKAAEFEKLIIQRAIEKADESIPLSA